MFVEKIEKGAITLQDAIMSEESYVTDLDICMFMNETKIQTCIFSSFDLRGFEKDQTWYICGTNYEFKHYFIRSNPSHLPNTILTYHVVNTALSMNEMGDFSRIFQKAIMGDPEEKKGIMSIEDVFKLN